MEHARLSVNNEVTVEGGTVVLTLELDQGWYAPDSGKFYQVKNAIICNELIICNTGDCMTCAYYTEYWFWIL